MTTIDTTAPRSAAIAIAPRVTRALARLSDALADRAARRATRRALAHLDDRELADIGLTRADVHGMR